MEKVRINEVYDHIGDETTKKLVETFYNKIDTDEILRPMFPEDLTYGTKFNYLFLKQIFGGPRDYQKYRGHPFMRKRHLLFKIGEKEKDQWLKLMFESIDEVSITHEGVRAILHSYFTSMANHMINQKDKPIGVGSFVPGLKD